MCQQSSDPDARPIVVAFASDDGISFTATHFGSAKRFCVYETDGVSFTHVADLSNTTKDETRHADPDKAKSVLEVLAASQVQVVVAPRFGPNIVRFSKLLSPVVVSVDTIESAWPLLLDNWEQIKALIAESPDTRGHLTLEAQSDTHLLIDLERCVACGACVEVCPVDALSMEDPGPQVDDALCVRCGTCIPVCPVEALALP